MKHFLLLAFVLLTGQLAVADGYIPYAEYIDPVYKVTYKYKPGSGVARVKEGLCPEQETDTLELYSGNPGVSGDIVILEKFTVDGQEYVVNRIGDCAFAFCGITSVTIPPTVKHIFEYAFYKCKSLRSPSFPNGLEYIYNLAFYGCEALSSVDLPEGLKYLTAESFARCLNLKHVSLPSSLEHIFGCPFSGCPNLESVVSLITEPCESTGIVCDNPGVTLYVPAGTKEKYIENNWNDFKNIIEQDTNSRPMFVDGRTWKYVLKKPVYEPTEDGQTYQRTWNDFAYSWMVDGDSLVDGKACKKIYCDSPEGRHLYGLGYEDGRKASICHFSIDPAFYPFVEEGEWHELYDFNASVGSTTSLLSNYAVQGIGKAAIRNLDWNYIDAVFQAPGGNDEIHRYIVEGVGCDRGLFDFENIVNDGSVSEYVGCYDGDECIFSREDFNVLAQTLTTIQSKMVMGTALKTSPSYNLQGVRVPDPQKGSGNQGSVKTLYIRNGKKYIR